MGRAGRTGTCNLSGWEEPERSALSYRPRVTLQVVSPTPSERVSVEQLHMRPVFVWAAPEGCGS